MYAGIKPPKRWLFCDGSWVSRSQYSDLYSVIGDRFGYKIVDIDQWYYDYYRYHYDPNNPDTWDDYGPDWDSSRLEKEFRPGMFRLPNLKSPIIDWWGRLKPELRSNRRIEVPGYNRTFPDWTPRERVVGHLHREDQVKYIIRYEDDPIDTRKHRKFFNMMYDLRLLNRHTL